MLMTKSIDTSDLSLRQLEPHDAFGPYSLWMTDEHVTRYLESRFRTWDARSLSAYISEMCRSDDCLLLGIFHLRYGVSPDVHIGNVKIGPLNMNHRKATIGVMIGDRGYWGSGFATQAVRAVSDYAFDVLALDRLEASFYADNVASMKAFSRAGFVEEGRLRGGRALGASRSDEVLMGLLRDDVRS